MSAGPVRKQIGYGPIGAEHAEALQKFYAAHFNPYLNFHRPCGYATVTINPKGKRKRTYRHRLTPHWNRRAVSGSFVDWKMLIRTDMGRWAPDLG